MATKKEAVKEEPQIVAEVVTESVGEVAEIMQEGSAEEPIAPKSKDLPARNELRIALIQGGAIQNLASARAYAQQVESAIDDILLVFWRSDG